MTRFPVSANLLQTKTRSEIEELPFVDTDDLCAAVQQVENFARLRYQLGFDLHVAVADDMIFAEAIVHFGLKIWTRCRAICARRSRRMSSSLLPLNMLPQITSIQPKLTR